jgi:ricin-type beta-trefoil lectin protein
MKLSTRGAALLVGTVMALLTMVVPSAAYATGNAVTGPPTGLYQLQNSARVQCLVGQTTNKVVLAPCDVAVGDQAWVLEPAAQTAYYRLRGFSTGKCLAIIANGNVRISACNNDFSDQWWRIEPSPDANAFMVTNYLRGTCLAAPRANGDATSFQCEPTFTDQRWFFVPR